MRRTKNFIVVICILAMVLTLQGCSTITINSSSFETAETAEILETAEISESSEMLTEASKVPIDEKKQEQGITIEINIASETEEEKESNKIIIDTQNYELQNDYSCYYYSQLTREQKTVFGYILENPMLIQNDYIGFTNIKLDDFNRVVQAIEIDTLSSRVNQFSYYEEEGVFFSKIEFDSMTEEETSEALRIANDILETIDGNSQEMLIIQIYDWCTKNIQYDETRQREHTNDLYGALVEKECVCTGFSKAFSYLCNQKGIETICVVNDEHMWNYVFFDSKWYSVDTTWGENGTTKYLMEGKESLEKHMPKIEDFSVPEISEISLYPEQKYAEEYISSLERNIQSSESLMNQIDDADRYEDYEDVYELCYEAEELAEEILENSNSTLYYRYLNTDNFFKKASRLRELIEQINDYDW